MQVSRFYQLNRTRVAHEAFFLCHSGKQVCIMVNTEVWHVRTDREVQVYGG